MNDVPFLDLFVLDLPDLTSCIPNPCEAVEPWPCPPVMGGAPGWWDDLWDFLGDIWGGAGDLAEKIGRSFDKLWTWIWEKVGGGIRWLYNQLLSVLGWLKDTAVKIWDTVYDILHRFVYWLVPKLTAVWDTVYDILHRFTTWLIPKLTGLGDTVYDILHRIVTWIIPKLTDIWDTVYDILNRVAHKIPDTLSAIWDFLRIDVFRHISGAAAGIGDAVTDAFEGIQKALEKALETIGDKLSDAIRWPWEHIFEPFTDVVERKLAIPGKLLDGQYRDLRDLLDDVIDPAPAIIAGIAGVIILGLVIAMITTAITTILVQPLCEPHVQTIRAGVGAELLTVGVLQNALNRGFIDERTMDDHLSRSGYDDTASKAIKDLRYLIPSPTDLIRMAVREVFNPQLREELTLDAEFPDPFLPWAQKLGYSEEWARNYWAMHWDLPSPSQGFEMLHRGLISEQDLAGLLKALDYAPVWRDKLQAIAYSPITRVDLRRLYKSEVISEDDVFDGYKALGYNDERARWLTDFTKKYYSPEDETQLDEYTEATASQIRLAYRRHVILRPEALDKLMELGYSEDVADFLLATDDVQLALNPTTDAGVPVRDLTVSIIRTAYAEKLWARDRAQAELEVLGYLAWEADLLLQLEDLAQQRELAGLAETVIKELYLANAIDEAEAARQLDDLEELPERRDLLIQRWTLQRAQKPKRLTLAQTQKAFKLHIFTEPEFLAELSVMGYNDRDADIIRAITPEE